MKTTYSLNSISLIFLFFIMIFTLHAVDEKTALPALGESSGGALEQGWQNPPLQAKLRAYWWWLNGNVSPEAITKDLEWMKEIGMGGGLVFDAGNERVGKEGHAAVPKGPMFGSAEWRKLFRHTLSEADRLGLEMGLSIQSGWNLGGPMVTPERAAKVIVWTETVVHGSGAKEISLPKPTEIQYLPNKKVTFFKDTSVLAYKLNQDPSKPSSKRPIRQLSEKAAYHELGGSATDCSPLLLDDPATPGEEDLQANGVIDLSDKLSPEGILRWTVPEGSWVVLRFGYTNNGSRVTTSSGDWKGMVLDYLSEEALTWYWKEVIDPIIEDVKPYCGKTWKMVQTDSWELGGVNWTDTLPAEFRKRRGYDLYPWLPVIAGKIVESREESNRFLNDFRRTIADCVADNHYGMMSALAKKYGIGIQPESAGPHTAPLDGLMCYGRSDWPMSEFWAPSAHRPSDDRRFFVKQASSAAHIYGKPIVCAEGFTTVGPHWDDILWSSQKPSFDHEACAGLNLVFWHAFTCSPKEMGLPGQEYFAGTHFNPQVTWAKQAPAFVGYLNRCQWMLQQGHFVADVLYYYGNYVPNIARLKEDDPAKVLPQYDYDVINEEVLLKAEAKEGRVTLPSGMSYRVLVLPNLKGISLEVIRKLRELAQKGAVIVGPRPEHATGRQEDGEIVRIAEELWGRGVIKEQTALVALAALKVEPDVEACAHWIHRSTGDAEIYFISNQTKKPLREKMTFRIAGKTPELWDAVSGSRQEARTFSIKEGRTTLPVELEPYGSRFVVFRKPAISDSAESSPVVFQSVQELAGPWEVSFREKKVTFEKLIDWSTSTEDSIKYFSGTATYRKTFDCAADHGSLFLELGNLSMLAEVRLNGKNLGVVWTPPWRVEITDAVKAGENVLEIDVVNGWWNQLVGDPKKEWTKTNISLSPSAKPQESGLLGPVTLKKLSPP